MDFKAEILKVIQDGEKEIKRFLDRNKAGRTHAFLGSCKHITRPEFSKHGEHGRTPCILGKVYQQCGSPPPPDTPIFKEDTPPYPIMKEYRPFYQLYRLDCVYPTPRRCDKMGYPVVWDNEWLIEVENDPKKFCYTMRVLLDFMGQNRLGIFFADGPDIKKLTEEFLPIWNAFSLGCPFADELNLQAIFFPESYSTWDAYASASISFTWDALDRSFVAT
jgi:hypothetical protein